MNRTAAAQAPPHARWQVTGGIRDAVARADLTIVAVPFPSLDEVLYEVAAAGYAGLVTDVTSIKGPVRDLVDRYQPTAADRLVIDAARKRFAADVVAALEAPGDRR